MTVSRIYRVLAKSTAVWGRFSPPWLKRNVMVEQVEENMVSLDICGILA